MMAIAVVSMVLANLPYTCDRVRALVSYAGSIQAAEAYAAQNGVRLTARQRKQAYRCIREAV